MIGMVTKRRVIIRVRVFNLDGEIHRLEELGRPPAESNGLSVFYSLEERWVRYTDGNRHWLCSGLPFELEYEDFI